MGTEKEKKNKEMNIKRRKSFTKLQRMKNNECIGNEESIQRTEMR